MVEKTETTSEPKVKRAKTLEETYGVLKSSTRLQCFLTIICQPWMDFIAKKEGFSKDLDKFRSKVRSRLNEALDKEKKEE